MHPIFWAHSSRDTIRPNEMMSHNSLDFARFMIQVVFFIQVIDMT